ncbi:MULTISPECIES: PilT/PilU family type 4a pilus ATPase [unclassified Neptuniibacter]|uniref:PilT/PilU family type 4a pilus ATPase n=1 Tax=unclassified Neptuniibacter TaxID=2630693 RepID=UPI000C65D75C|nr:MULTISPECIES: PilT/PilU family type 4a pilus ATPase [unclassified Neptuniibacter]MAY42240.1 type IV pili twitching motility protein PilT [Oceanospirillaceae bacterium]|tara:strand:+ start:9991 stop:11163 length:1173 start_codon:yes stop_codon:yes gene_type:complete
MEFKDYLTILAKRDGSDLYLTTGAPPCAKFEGKLTPLSKEPYKPGEIEAIARSLMDEQQQAAFEEELEMNLAYSIPKVARYRINIFKQRNQYSLVARNIKADIPKMEDLGLPSTLKDVIMEKRGLVLFVGATGSGKSTSLAALIDHRNRNSGGHIITIEDPIEFVHNHRKSLINQREVGVDTRNFHNALKNALRQAPDVILIGEIRDQETMEQCLTYAETGHLAISTLHANNANQAIDRIINFFPQARHKQIFHDLALNLKAIISQRLIPTIDGKRCAAIEILLGTSTIQELIMKGEIKEIKEVMSKASDATGMQTFDDSLYKLFKQEKITQDQALINSDSANDMRLRMNLAVVEEKKEPSDAAPDPEESSFDEDNPLAGLKLLDEDEEV